MFPYLDFAVVAFALFAGFGLGLLLAYLLRGSGSRGYFDGDGGELVPLADATDAVATPSSNLAKVIRFPARRAS
jgi:hypothetical protein